MRLQLYGYIHSRFYTQSLVTIGPWKGGFIVYCPFFKKVIVHCPFFRKRIVHFSLKAIVPVHFSVILFNREGRNMQYL